MRDLQDIETLNNDSHGNAERAARVLAAKSTARPAAEIAAAHARRCEARQAQRYG